MTLKATIPSTEQVSCIYLARQPEITAYDATMNRWTLTYENPTLGPTPWTRFLEALIGSVGPAQGTSPFKIQCAGRNIAVTPYSMQTSPSTKQWVLGWSTRCAGLNDGLGEHGFDWTVGASWVTVLLV